MLEYKQLTCMQLAIYVVVFGTVSNTMELYTRMHICTCAVLCNIVYTKVWPLHMTHTYVHYHVGLFYMMFTQV